MPASAEPEFRIGQAQLSAEERRRRQPSNRDIDNMRLKQIRGLGKKPAEPSPAPDGKAKLSPRRKQVAPAARWGVWPASGAGGKADRERSPTADLEAAIAAVRATRGHHTMVAIEADLPWTPQDQAALDALDAADAADAAGPDPLLARAQWLLAVSDVAIPAGFSGVVPLKPPR